MSREIKVEAIIGDLEGGFRLKIKREDGTEQGENYYGLISYEAIQKLEGKLLTLVDATFTDKEQRKAQKTSVRRTIWFDWVKDWIYRGDTTMPVGMPNLERN